MTQARTSSIFSPGEVPALADFWSLAEAEREELLLRGITRVHAYHFERNTAYRNTVAARGVGLRVGSAELPRMLRATSHRFQVLRRHPGHALSPGSARGLRGLARGAGLRGHARRPAPLPLAVPVP